MRENKNYYLKVNTGHEELNFTYNYLALKVAPSLILEHLAVTNFPS